MQTRARKTCFGSSGGGAWAARRGLTLLEVLISIFVLSVGLMGVAALIPVGRQQIQKGSQFDRSSACGRAALAELLIRDYLNPDMWMNSLGNSYGPQTNAFPNGSFVATDAWIDWDYWNSISAVPNVSLPPPPAFQSLTGIVDPTPIALGNSVCIDPLFIVRNSTDAGTNVANHQRGVSSFPFHLDLGYPAAGTVQEPDADGDLGTGPVPPRMQRITVRAWPKAANIGGAPPPMLRIDPAPPGGNDVLARDTLAERIFTWRDETQFDLPANAGRRPVPAVLTSSGGAGLRTQSAAEYSWFATLTPTSPSPTPLDGSPIPYRVSVVVVFKRDLNWVVRGEVDQPPGVRPAPKERMVCCEFLGGGLSGGLARLWLPVRSGAANNNPAAPDRSDMPRVRPGQWIMLSAWRLSSKVPPLTAVADFRWYRVAAADAALVYQDGTAPNPSPPAGLQGRWYQEVTLQGPDWKEDDYIDPDEPNVPSNMRHTTWPLNANVSGAATLPYPPTFATIVEGVVGVFETNWVWHP